MACSTRSLVLSLVIFSACGEDLAQGPARLPIHWEQGPVANLSGLKVTLSKPILVGRSHGYFWFPTLVPLANGDLMAIMSNYADEHTSHPTAAVTWSTDGGLTWTRPVETYCGESHLRLANGDELILPYYLRPAGDGVMAAPYSVCPKGERRVVIKSEGVKVSGWPHPDKSFDPKLGMSGFVFNGQTVVLKDGKYLATLYGSFQDAKRYSLVAAESADGVDWKIRSVVADQDCPLPGGEGPCESAVCRLKDGRLMIVFRIQSAYDKLKRTSIAYGQSWSNDEGKTWSEAVAMQGPFAVQPSLAAFKDGMLALSGGRPGLFLWLNVDGSGKDWQKVDLLANHNAHVPAEPIKNSGNTSSYTEIVVRDEHHLLYMYDRLPSGWRPIPAESAETNSVWIVQATIERAK
jgi:hypothetical protein